MVWLRICRICIISWFGVVLVLSRAFFHQYMWLESLPCPQICLLLGPLQATNNGEELANSSRIISLKNAKTLESLELDCCVQNVFISKATWSAFEASNTKGQRIFFQTTPSKEVHFFRHASLPKLSNTCLQKNMRLKNINDKRETLAKIEQECLQNKPPFPNKKLLQNKLSENKPTLTY